MIGIAIVGLGNLALGIWVLSLKTDLYRARKTIVTRNRRISMQRRCIGSCQQTNRKQKRKIKLLQEDLKTYFSLNGDKAEDST